MAEDADERHAELTDLEIKVLQFEERWEPRAVVDYGGGMRRAGNKAAVVRAMFGISLARYQQILVTIVDKPEAMRHSPMLVKRILRRQERAQEQRAARTFKSTG